MPPSESASPSDQTPLELLLLDVALAPSALAARREMPLPARTTYIVVDVVRATTTLATMLECGARRVFVAPGIAEARAARQTLAASALLAGEVGGIAPPGFDLGNSPAECARTPLMGRDIVFATTNGTRALLACTGGAAVLAGALRNASAVASCAVDAVDMAVGRGATPATPAMEQVRYTGSGATGDDVSQAFISPNHRATAAVVVVCSGRGGLPAYDDALCAGMIAERVCMCARELGCEIRLAEGARIALAAAGEAQRAGVLAALRASDAGRAVVEVGLAGDLDWCAAVDATDVVPQVTDITHDGLLVIGRREASTS